MTRVTAFLTWPIRWLRRPQRSNLDALLTGAIGSVLILALVYVVGAVLDAIDLVSFNDATPVWLTALIGGSALGLGLIAGRRSRLTSPQTQELYTAHTRDALADLRRLASGELPDFTIRDYIETGIFHPAHLLLTTRERDRGDIRFSILHPSNDDNTIFTMKNEEGLYPALGHRMESRQAFSLEIDTSFAGLAYRTGRVQVSNDVRSDERWTPHPKAQAGREYESIVSVPLTFEGEVDGVLNVVGEHRDAFDTADQTYISLLGSAIDVARAIGEQWRQPTR